MPQGPGKYDGLCAWVRRATEAEVAIVVVVRGTNGSGFSVQSTVRIPNKDLAAFLRNMADQVEQTPDEHQ